MVDNGSTDGTEAYFRRFAPPFPLRYARNAANVGLISALNQGARLAGGEVICFLHNDTEMREPSWLERLEAAHQEGLRDGFATVDEVEAIDAIIEISGLLEEISFGIEHDR